MCLNYPETTPPTPGPQTNFLPQNQSLVTKRLGTSALEFSTKRKITKPLNFKFQQMEAAK